MVPQSLKRGSMYAAYNGCGTVGLTEFYLGVLFWREALGPPSKIKLWLGWEPASSITQDGAHLDSVARRYWERRHEKTYFN